MPAALGRLDAFGHANNAVCFRLIEDAWIACFARTDLDALMAETKAGAS